jgi:hypothetical protein
MKLENTSQASALDAARAELYAGIVDDDGAKTILECSQRTLERYIAAGLPHLKIGAKRFFVIKSTRSWLMTHERSRAPRGRGRPRRGAA